MHIEIAFEMKKLKHYNIFEGVENFGNISHIGCIFLETREENMYLIPNMEHKYSEQEISTFSLIKNF